MLTFRTRGIPSRRAGLTFLPTLLLIITQLTLHQGAVEEIFLESMSSMNIAVERPVVPTSIELSTDEAKLSGPHSHPVKVQNICWWNSFDLCAHSGSCLLGCAETSLT